jgi:hypothetical protein
MRGSHEAVALGVLLVLSWMTLGGCAASASDPSHGGDTRGDVGSGSAAPDPSRHPPEPTLTPEQREELLKEKERRRILDEHPPSDQRAPRDQSAPVPSPTR